MLGSIKTSGLGVDYDQALADLGSKFTALSTVTDATLSYAFTESFSLTMGANNIFNTYPDKWKNTRDGDVGQAASYSDGQTPYTRNANQFGFNGSYYFITAGVKF